MDRSFCFTMQMEAWFYKVLYSNNKSATQIRVLVAHQQWCWGTSGTQSWTLLFAAIAVSCCSGWTADGETWGRWLWNETKECSPYVKTGFIAANWKSYSRNFRAGNLYLKQDIGYGLALPGSLSWTKMSMCTANRVTRQTQHQRKRARLPTPHT